MPTGLHYDLPSSPSSPITDGELIYGFDVETKSTNYKQSMIQNAEDWTPLAYGTEGLDDFFLVEETAPESIGGGMVKWDRIYSQVPSPYTDYEAVAYNYNTLYFWDPSTSNWIRTPLVSLTTTVPTRLEYTFHLTDDPETDVSIDLGWKIVQIGDYYFHNGTNPFADLNNVPPYYLGEDSAVTLWKGNIWRKANRMVPIPTLERSL